MHRFVRGDAKVEEIDVIEEYEIWFCLFSCDIMFNTFSLCFFSVFADWPSKSKVTPFVHWATPLLGQVCFDFIFLCFCFAPLTPQTHKSHLFSSLPQCKVSSATSVRRWKNALLSAKHSLPLATRLSSQSRFTNKNHRTIAFYARDLSFQSLCWFNMNWIHFFKKRLKLK